MHYEVDVTIARALDDSTRRFLEAVRQAANRLTGFEGDHRRVTLTVEVTAGCPTDAVRAAAGEVARIFPGCADEKYGQPREL